MRGVRKIEGNRGRLKVKIWLIIGVYLFTVMSSAQTQDTTARLGPVDLVLPYSGIPLTLDQTEERTKTLPDGTSAVAVIRSKIFRDSRGRLREESDYLASGKEPSTTQITLIDPSDSMAVVLLTSPKIAYRVRGPSSGGGLALKGMGEALPPGEWSARTDHLGMRSIEGIEFDGTRTTQTVTGKPELTNAIEQWYSSELKLTGYAVASGPYGTHTARIQNLKRGEQDPALFNIPQDYKIIDFTIPTP